MTTDETLIGAIFQSLRLFFPIISRINNYTFVLFSEHVENSVEKKTLIGSQMQTWPIFTIVRRACDEDVTRA